eukprot:TRINITY_DN26909_c0_g1_i1.p1 TRINITY_DN26909_c0_g1~~TRINITY_DN26909_c0_g1_i1.p1  ORF type:complete len:253 (+),score=44.38 TRINITY_DN26909_c0_g1_i1:46-759(+)
MASSAPIESELASKLRKRQLDIQQKESAQDAIGGNAAASKAFEAKIDGELAAKLRNRSSTVEKQSVGDEPANDTLETNGKTFQPKIDSELADKLRLRSSGVSTQKKGFPSPPITPPYSSRGKSFQPHIDNELADKLRNRSTTIQKQEDEGFAPEDPKTRSPPKRCADGSSCAEESATGVSDDSELGKKLAKQRSAVDAVHPEQLGNTNEQPVHRPDLYDKQDSRFCIAGCRAECAVQ